jgi:diguanylate cyclase (GGDEF)-like protein
MSDTRAPGAERRALVVDDDQVMRLLAHEALARMGFAVEEAEGGEQALTAVDRSPPDFVLLDVDMPGMDGFETCASLRQQSGGTEIPVLMATGLTDSETIDRAFRAGATDFIKKPIDWQLLNHRVRFLMRAHEAFSELRHTLSELRESQDRLANAQRLARIGNWEWIPGSSEMLWSEEVYRIFQIEPRAGASTYEAFLSVVHPDDRPMLEKAMQQAACEDEAWSLDHRIVTGSGAERFVHQQVEMVREASGAFESISGTIQDISDRREAEEQIRYLAYYDSLTGLPNRRLLFEHLDRSLKWARERGELIALLFLDLDRFKRVNDTLGHAAGDQLLEAVAKELVSCVRTVDYVGRSQAEDNTPVSRLGGDEFTIVLKHIRSSADAGHAARRVLGVLRTPFEISGQTIVMSGSVGISVFPNDGEDTHSLLRSADAAMYQAKKEGRDTYQFFSESMNERAMRNLRLESSLRSALDHDELLLYFQPQFDARTGVITGAEALARWQSPEFGLVSPGEFIPLAEETGLIGPLGDWALQTACAQNRAWQETGQAGLRVAVNVSSHQLRRDGFVEKVEGTLRNSGMQPELLEIEITESALIEDVPRALDALSRLKRMGVRLALDDFGTGCSSLSDLVRFPIDVIKIDTSFVADIGPERQGSAIIAAVLAMAHRLHLTVTAEGVETAEQEAFLRSEGCDTLQGFICGRPVPAEEFRWKGPRG